MADDTYPDIVEWPDLEEFRRVIAKHQEETADVDEVLDGGPENPDACDACG